MRRAELFLLLGAAAVLGVLLSAAHPVPRSRTVCQEQLRRLTQGVHAYAETYDNWLPPLIERKARWEFWMAKVLPFLRDARDFYCPANPRSQKILSDENDGERDLLPAVFDIGSTAYGMNCYLSSDGGKAPWRRLPDAASPDYTICIGDCSVARGYLLRPSRACWETDYLPCHDNSMNVSFLDGHTGNFTGNELGLAERFGAWKKDLKRWKNWKAQ